MFVIEMYITQMISDRNNDERMIKQMTDNQHNVICLSNLYLTINLKSKKNIIKYKTFRRSG
jgi:hypothetical protein